MSSDLMFNSVQVDACVLDSLEALESKTDYHDFCMYFGLAIQTCYGVLAQNPTVLLHALRWSLDPNQFNSIFRLRLKETLQVRC